MYANIQIQKFREVFFVADCVRCKSELVEAPEAEATQFKHTSIVETSLSKELHFFKEFIVSSCFFLDV